MAEKKIIRPKNEAERKCLGRAKPATNGGWKQIGAGGARHGLSEEN